MRTRPRGPMPKRDEARARRNEPAGGPARKGEMRPVKIPAVKKHWRKETKAFWNGIKTSGTADYYQNSDWQMALMLCDAIDNWYYGMELGKRGTNSLMQFTIIPIMSQLGLTEGARRGVLRLELMPAEEDHTDEVAEGAAEYRDMLESSSNVVPFEAAQ